MIDTPEFIGVPIHKDVTTYEERIFGGVTGRQVLCFGIAGALALVIGLVVTQVLHLPVDIAFYPIAIVCVPIALMGVVRPKGMAPEVYLRLVWSHFVSPQRLAYKPARTEASGS